jgi:hypothetical protein
MRSLHAFGLCAIALAFALPAQAANNDGYWVDKDGKILKSANTGLCFRSARWTEKSADRECFDKFKQASMKK